MSQPLRKLIAVLYVWSNTSSLLLLCLSLCHPSFPRYVSERTARVDGRPFPSYLRRGHTPLSYTTEFIGAEREPLHKEVEATSNRYQSACEDFYNASLTLVDESFSRMVSIVFYSNEKEVYDLFFLYLSALMASIATSQFGSLLMLSRYST